MEGYVPGGQASRAILSMWLRKEGERERGATDEGDGVGLPQSRDYLCGHTEHSSPQPHLQPLSREGSSCPSTLPSQSHPASGVWQQNHLHTHKEQLFPLRESSLCLWDLARMESKLGVTSRDNSICAVPADTCQEGNEKPSLGATWLFA